MNKENIFQFLFDLQQQTTKNDSPIIHEVSVADDKIFQLEIVQPLYKTLHLSPGVDRKTASSLIAVYAPTMIQQLINPLYNRMDDRINESLEYDDGNSKEYVIHSEEDVCIEYLTKFTDNGHLERRPLWVIASYAPCMNCARLISKLPGIKGILFFDKHPFKFDFDVRTSQHFIDTLREPHKQNYIKQHIDCGLPKTSPLTYLNKLGIHCVHVTDVNLY